MEHGPLMIQRRARAFITVTAVILSAVSASLVAQNKDKKQTDAQKRDTKAAVDAADAVMAGQPAANDFSATWVREDFLKALGNKEYVPFTVSLDTSKVTAPTVAFYWRVVAKSAAPETPPPGQKKDDKKDNNKKKDFAYEDISFAPVTAGQSPLRVSRSFTVPPGAYDVFGAAREPLPEKAPKKAP